MSSNSLILRSGLPREPPVSVARQGRERWKEAEEEEEEEVERLSLVGKLVSFVGGRKEKW